MAANYMVGIPDNETDERLIRQAREAGALTIRFYFVMKPEAMDEGGIQPRVMSPYYYTLARAAAEIDTLRQDHAELAVASIVHLYCPEEPEELAEWRRHRAAQESEVRAWQQ